MHTLTARFIVNTPLFLGGADNTQSAELRLSSLKGCLRFWWRALAWSRLGGDLPRIHDEEQKLFGSADTGQGAFLMRLVDLKEFRIRRAGDNFPFDMPLSGLAYLGYGAMTYKGELQKAMIQPPCSMALEMFFREKPPEDFLDALKAFGLLGGMGARVRKGFGSLTLLDLELDRERIFSAPASVDAYRTEIRSLIGQLPTSDTTPPYSAFSGQARVVILQQGRGALDLLNSIGSTMQMYRSWGRNGMVNRKPAEKNFPEDHGWFKLFASRNPEKYTKSYLPRRIVFGLPHSYFSQGREDDPGTIYKAKCLPDEISDRRASPLFLHIHILGKESYIAVATVFKSIFLPEDVNVQTSSWYEIRKTKYPLSSGKGTPVVDYKVIDDFIDGYYGPHGEKSARPYFPGKIQVVPA